MLSPSIVIYSIAGRASDMRPALENGVTPSFTGILLFSRRKRCFAATDVWL